MHINSILRQIIQIQVSIETRGETLEAWHDTNAKVVFRVALPQEQGDPIPTIELSESETAYSMGSEAILCDSPYVLSSGSKGVRNHLTHRIIALLCLKTESVRNIKMSPYLTLRLL